MSRIASPETQVLSSKRASGSFTLGAPPSRYGEAGYQGQSIIARTAQPSDRSQRQTFILMYEAGGKTHEAEAPGISVFYKDKRGDIFHAYSSYARGGDLLIGTYNYLDLMPKGRNEEGDLKGWVRRHDEYER
jgi:predicted dithiol-disulfide oxidoreductase (DUF899 family)